MFSRLVTVSLLLVVWISSTKINVRNANSYVSFMGEELTEQDQEENEAEAKVQLDEAEAKGQLDEAEAKVQLEDSARGVRRRRARARARATAVEDVPLPLKEIENSPSSNGSSRGNRLLPVQAGQRAGLVGNDENSSTSNQVASRTAPLTGEGNKMNKGGSQDGNNNNNNDSKILMATLVFGEEYANSRKLRMFIESAKASTKWNFAIVGDQPSYPLPPNFVGINITFPEFLDRVDTKLFNGTMIRKQVILRQKKWYRKVNDFKPQIAYLFPEVFEGYHWWGYMDNDVVVGNLAKAYPPNYLKNFDIVSGNTGSYNKFTAWGPFTMFRNTPLINSLFMKSGIPLADLYDKQNYFFLDEWATTRNEMYNSSMTGIINALSKDLGIRTAVTHFPILWDKSACLMQYKAFAKEDWYRVPPHCGECVFQQGTLRRTHDDHQCPLAENRGEVYLCHYHKSKRVYWEESLYQNDTKYQQLITAGEFRVTYTTGFQLLDEPYYNPHQPPSNQWNEAIDRPKQAKKIANKCAKRDAMIANSKSSNKFIVPKAASQKTA